MRQCPAFLVPSPSCSMSEEGVTLKKNSTHASNHSQYLYPQGKAQYQLAADSLCLQGHCACGSPITLMQSGTLLVSSINCPAFAISRLY